MAVATKVSSRTNSFPKLMVRIKLGHNQGTIVLFSEKKVGVVVFAPKESEYEVGDYSSEWNIDSFSDYDGTIELKNS